MPLLPPFFLLGLTLSRKANKKGIRTEYECLFPLFAAETYNLT
jgi:hypothetical protein